jgi:hypothetical protein
VVCLRTPETITHLGTRLSVHRVLRNIKSQSKSAFLSIFVYQTATMGHEWANSHFAELEMRHAAHPNLSFHGL